MDSEEESSKTLLGLIAGFVLQRISVNGTAGADGSPGSHGNDGVVTTITDPKKIQSFGTK